MHANQAVGGLQTTLTVAVPQQPLDAVQRGKEAGTLGFVVVRNAASILAEHGQAHGDVEPVQHMLSLRGDQFGQCAHLLAAVRKDWVLPTALGRIRRKLAGSNDGDRQMVAILATVLTDGLQAVEAACAQAIAEGVHSADVIINILSRRRDPGPAATILTPDALTLRHAPLADCARYDHQLRSN